MVISFEDDTMNILGEDIPTTLKPIEEVAFGKNKINYQVGKDFDGQPIYLLDKGVEEVVDYVTGPKLTFDGEKAVVRGFFKSTELGGGKKGFSICPFAVVKLNKKDKPQYLSMFGDLSDKPTKEGSLYYQYMNKQISLDEIPQEFFKNQKFREAVYLEEEGRLILKHLDEAETAGVELDMDKLVKEMDVAKKEFDAKTLGKQDAEQE